VFDDLTFTPPADLDVLVLSVMERGRQRHVLRRAISGAVAALVTLLVAAGSLPFASRTTSTAPSGTAAPAPRVQPDNGRGGTDQNATEPSAAVGSGAHRTGTHRTRTSSSSLASGPPLAAPLQQATRRTVVFVSNLDDPVRDIYVYNGGADRPKRLTTTRGVDTWPTWSPDARQIAFYSQRDGHSEIYVMNADGSNQHRITPLEADIENTQPAWSPDGRMIAFVRYQGTPDASVSVEPSELTVIAPDGSNRRGLGVSGGQPSWAPDNRHIAYVTVSGDLLVLDITTNAAPRLVVPAGDNRTINERPAFSPDGTRIAFSRLENGVAQLYVVNADGSGMHRVVKTDTDALGPAWSPDGTTLVYSDQPRVFCSDTTDPTTCHADVTATAALWVIRADGLKAEPLVEGFGDADEAKFAPTTP
jgi:Tol biopolymer transport system component